LKENLLKYAEENLEVLLKPFGQLDCLLYYTIICQKLQKYLQTKTLATKTWLPKANIPNFIRRASKDKPLFADNVSMNVTLDFIKLRSESEKSEVINDLTIDESLIWTYFVPRKYIELFYSTNGEGKGNDIDRIFFDIDRGENISAKQAQKVAQLLIEEITSDNKLRKLVNFDKPFCYWTGKSFHIYLFLEESVKNSFYNENISFSSKNPENSFTEKWAKRIDEQLDFKVVASHERNNNTINIDPSQTPSGKLSRIPLGALHMADSKTIDGVSVPLTDDQLEDKQLTDNLMKFQPLDIIKNISIFTNNLPRKYRV